MKKSWILLTVLCILVGVFVTCNQGKHEKKEIVIAIIPKVDNAIFDQVKESAIKAAKGLGIVLTWEAPTSIDGKKQKELIENLIQYKVDGILISCNDAELLKDPINKAMKAGIKVATFDSDCPKSDRIFYVGTDNKKAGKVCAETMMNLYRKANKNQGQILVLCGGVSALNMAERLSGFRSVISDGKIAEVLYSYEIPDYGKELLTYNLARNHKINGVQMFWGVPVLNGVDSFPAMSKFMKGGGISVFFDVSIPLLNYIKDHPNCATMKQDFSAMGRDGVTNLYNAIKGKTYKIEILYDVKVIDHNNVTAELKKL
ncbi:MAG: substrate-binding domain-containing protein [Bacteroidota bacterium]|nr:substrate-binding domain-containing protein [Bacteroidota bacterium]